jgi:hypothetical protein
MRQVLHGEKLPQYRNRKDASKRAKKLSKEHPEVDFHVILSPCKSSVADLAKPFYVDETSLIRNWETLLVTYRNEKLIFFRRTPRSYAR